MSKQYYIHSAHLGHAAAALAAIVSIDGSPIKIFDGKNTPRNIKRLPLDLETFKTQIWNKRGPKILRTLHPEIEDDLMSEEIAAVAWRIFRATTGDIFGDDVNDDIADVPGTLRSAMRATINGKKSFRRAIKLYATAFRRICRMAYRRYIWWDAYYGAYGAINEPHVGYQIKPCRLTYSQLCAAAKVNRADRLKVLVVNAADGHCYVLSTERNPDFTLTERGMTVTKAMVAALENIGKSPRKVDVDDYGVINGDYGADAVCAIAAERCLRNIDEKPTRRVMF